MHPLTGRWSVQVRPFVAHQEEQPPPPSDVGEGRSSMSVRQGSPAFRAGLVIDGMTGPIGGVNE